jgi:nitrite reductase/ring-hydroxylating ferredoxin subunit
MAFQIVATTDEIADGEHKLIQSGRREIGVFREGDSYYAVLNHCPHAGAPICQGTVQGVLVASADGEYELQSERLVLRCPWHHWEFELESGAPVCDIKQRLKTFPVKVEGNHVLVDM